MLRGKTAIDIKAVVSWVLTLFFYAAAVVGLLGSGAFAVACFILHYPWLGMLALLGVIILAISFWRLIQGRWRIGGLL